MEGFSIMNADNVQAMDTEILKNTSQRFSRSRTRMSDFHHLQRVYTNCRKKKSVLEQDTMGMIEFPFWNSWSPWRVEYRFRIGFQEKTSGKVLPVRPLRMRWVLTPNEAEGISQIKKKKVFWTSQQKVSNTTLTVSIFTPTVFNAEHPI